jgi:RHS repeat-associated protein
VVTDLVGAPVALVDRAGEVVWRPRSTLWGVRQPNPADRAGCPLGMPGQYHDAETGMAYNLRRYYDPATARYLSADPLGLVPGPDPYAYTRHPLVFADPFGLAAYTTLYRTSPKARGDSELVHGLNPDHFPRTEDGSYDGAAHFGNRLTAADWVRMHPDTHGVGFKVDVPDSWLQQRLDAGQMEVWEGFTDEHLEYVVPKELFGEFNAFQRHPWDGESV